MEKEGAARWLRRAGVPEPALIVDRSARSTRDSARRAAELLLPDCRRVWLATQPYHMRRAKLYFRQAGFEPLGLQIQDSVEMRDPHNGLRWIVREYGAWLLALGRAVIGPQFHKRR